jgi:hypothetical protein
MVWLAALFFVAAVVAAGGAYTARDRIAYGAVPLTLALLCGGRAWWLFAEEVLARRWFVWRFRRFEGPQAVQVAYAMRAAGLAFGLLGLWVIVLWLTR